MKPDFAVTIVCGDAYEAMADVVIPRVERLLGLEVRVERVEPVTVANSRVDTRRARMHDCCQLKLRLLDRHPNSRVMFFDLDWVPLRPWDWAALAEGVENPERSFVGVRQQYCAGWRHYDGGSAINGGFWIASAEHAPIFADALELWQEQGDPKHFGWEEYFLNTALDRAKLPVVWLPSAYNLQCKAATDLEVLTLPVMAAHACFAQDKVAAVRALCEAYPLTSDTDPAPPPSSRSFVQALERTVDSLNQAGGEEAVGAFKAALR